MQQLKPTTVLDGLRQMSQAAPMPNAVLIDALIGELRRNREILTGYEAIGAAGLFGAKIIRFSITKGEEAIRTGNVVDMLYAYNDLKETK